MKNVLFVQFYRKINLEDAQIFDLCNGFSDTYDLCKSKGDMVWYDNDFGYKDIELPINEGEVYISAWYFYHIIQAYKWALKYPKIKFVVGGPILTTDKNGKFVYFRILKELPKNLILTGKTVEKYFNVPNFTYNWNLELPDIVSKHDDILFSYMINNTCHWKKCTFCSIKYHSDDYFRKRQKFNFEFLNMEHYGKKNVRVNHGSLSFTDIKYLFEEFPVRDSIKYSPFFRPGKGENEVLYNILKQKNNISKIRFGIGLEFPSDRILNKIKKGFKVKDVIDFLNICKEHDNLEVGANIITGWDDITKKDVDDFDNFFEKLEYGSIKEVYPRWLFNIPDHNDSAKKHVRGPFYMGQFQEVDDEGYRLNKLIAEKLRYYSVKKGYRLYELSGIRI